MSLKDPTLAKKERWSCIPGFPGYQISDQGRVRNVNTGHILKASEDKFGNTHLSLYRNGKPWSKRPSQLKREAFGS